jgi:hypothetical protein
MSCRRVLSSIPVSKGFGNRRRQLGIETYKQEIQLIQVARIGQAGRGASIDAGAFGLDWIGLDWIGDSVTEAMSSLGCTLMRCKEL